MYKIKQLPEDFLVKELNSLPTKNQGRYIYCRLIKKNINTLDAIKILSREFHLKEKQLGFAGSKDRNAVTEQIISIDNLHQNISKQKIKELNDKLTDIKIELIGYADEPVSLGSLDGNYFEITVRNLEPQAIQHLKDINSIRFIPNYFDEQRFGRNSHNAQIGKHLLKREFKEAFELMEIKAEDNRYINVLQQLPLRLLRLYLNAYQSYLWNETLAEHLKQFSGIVKTVDYSLGKFFFVEDQEDLVIPLIGFDEIKENNNNNNNNMIKNKKIITLIKNIMRKENILAQDFIFRPIPALSLEGDVRPAFVEVKEFKILQESPDELNRDRKKVKLSFALPKGSYATIVVKAIFGQQ